VRLEPNLPADTLAVTAGVIAFLGHLYPIYLRFHGGKGVATGTGAVVVLSADYPSLAGFAAWLVTVSASRIVSFASLVARGRAVRTAADDHAATLRLGQSRPDALLPGGVADGRRSSITRTSIGCSPATKIA